MATQGDYDCLIVGGGPAGASAAAVLAERGRRVAVFEKEKFPRYHIGESMMPYCYFPLERLGLIGKMKASHYPKKYSVQFVSTNGKASQPFYFFQHLEHECSTTWQVVRSEFDTMLLDNARGKGAEIHEETAVKELIEEDGTVTGLRVQAKRGGVREVRAPLTIDCSGRDALTLSRRGWRVFDPVLNKIAIWTYYAGAKRDPGLDEGATTVAYIPEKGWFWYIPLPEDTVSVGIVSDKEYLYKDTRDPAEIFDREIANNSWIAEHLEPGRCMGRFFVTGEFSYRARHCASEGLLLAGDAFAFLDPVFSSGLFLALKSGVMAGDAVLRALEARDYSAAQFAPYSETLLQGIEVMRKLVYAFYDTNFRFKDVLMKYPEEKGPITDCLIGDLFKEHGELFRKIGEFAQLPEPLPHGRPLVPAAT